MAFLVFFHLLPRFLPFDVTVIVDVVAVFLRTSKIASYSSR